jgi:hypothetical protein
MDLIIQIPQFLFYCVNYSKCYSIVLIKHIDNLHTTADSHLDYMQTLMKTIQHIIQKLQQELELTIFKSKKPNARVLFTTATTNSKLELIYQLTIPLSFKGVQHRNQRTCSD